MRNKKIALILFMIFCILFIAAGLTKRHINEKEYKKSIVLLKNNDYDNALKTLNGLENYKNANSLIEQAKNEKMYYKALKCIEEKEYKETDSIIIKLSAFDEFDEKTKNLKYILAIKYFNSEEYDKAESIFKELNDYKKSNDYLEDIDFKKLEKTKKDIYTKACNFLNNKQYFEALKNFKKILDYKDSKKKAKHCEKAIRLELSHTISSGIRNSVGIKSNHTVVAVGDKTFERCNVGSWTDIVSVDCYGNYTVGLKYNGTVEVAGVINGNQYADVSKWKHIVDVAVGERYVIGLKSNGTVLAEGHNGDDQLDVDDWKDVVDIDAGWRFSVGLTNDGRLLFSGKCDNLRKDYEHTKNEWRDVTKIVASGGNPNSKTHGMGHVVGLKSDGTLIAIGDNSWKQCNFNKKDWNNITDIAAGDWYTVAVKDNNTVLITGKDKKRIDYIDKEIYDWEGICRVASGYGQTLGLKKDGSVVAIGFNTAGNRDMARRWKNMKTPKQD